MILIADRHAALVVPISSAIIMDCESWMLPGAAVLARIGPDGSYLTEEDGKVPVWFQDNINDAMNARLFNERVRGARKRMVTDDQDWSGRIGPSHLIRVGTVDLDRNVISDVLRPKVLEAWAGAALDSFYPLQMRSGANPENVRYLLDRPGEMLHLPPQVWQSANGQIVFQERKDALPEIIDHDQAGFPERMRAMGVTDNVIRLVCGREAVG